MNRRKFLRLGGAALVGSIAGCARYPSGIAAQQVVVEHRTIFLPRLNSALDGLRLVFMSDHHLFPFTPRELLEEAVEQTNSLRPDLVLLGGDYPYTKAESIYELAPLLSRLNAKYGVFAILGNHDHRCGPALIRSQLVAQSIEVLVNRGLHLGPKRGHLYLAGVDSVVAGKPDPARAFAGYRDGDLGLVLVHEPDSFPLMVRSTPAQLQLSGHSHGGQVRFPAVGPVILPKCGRIYHTGLYELDGRYVYTSRGLGMVGVPLRFDCPPELTAITLVAAKTPVYSS